MAVCARCSAENPDSTRFCGQCGARLDARSPASLIATEAGSYTRTAAAVARASRPSSDSSEDGRFVPGTLLGDRYRIVSLLGAGGMGEVYRATDLRLGQAVALKFLPEEMAQDPKALARFHNEIRIARQVAHPNVCRVYDLGEVEGFPYLSMEYVDGEDLHSLLRRIGRLPADKALEIARKLCAGLAAAHDKGVLHRDLKPSNIMIDGRGHVLITDFGLAGVIGDIDGLETRNGTPGYMAPEQLSGKEVSVESDIYALGVVLYEMFTGKRPFNASSRAELLEMEEEGLPPAPRTIVKDIDPAVESVILRCLDPDPRNRPPSALAVLGALPGGDPLAAALAAGETPSPEMVAAAGANVGLKPQRAMAWLAAVIVGLVVVAFCHQQSELIMKIPFDQSPEVLAATARDMLTQLGYTDHRVSQAYGFGYRMDPLRYLVRQLGFPLARLAKGRPAVMRFWYRTSPGPLAPHEVSDVIRAGQDDPPPDVPGMRTVFLDPQGRLLYLQAVPPAETEPGASRPPDWQTLFRLAGLDMSRFHPTEPRWTPPVSSDARAAWSGTYVEEPDIPLQVEAAGFEGKPVYFVIAGPWMKPATPAQASGDAKPPGEVVYIILQLIVMIGALPFARYNLKMGRSDTRGAVRLGSFCILMGIAAWAIGGTHVASVKEADLFFMATMRALIGGTCVAVTYLSFEPFVRRRWPQTLISWSRLLTGSLRDPLVGRDVLVGTAIGIVLTLIQSSGGLLYSLLPSGAALHIGIKQAVLSGGRTMAGEALFLIDDILYKALGILFLIFLARTILRSQWLAAGAVTLALSGIIALNEPIPMIGWPVNILFFGIIVMTLMRRGLLRMVVALFTTIFIGSFPLVSDFSVWYASEIVFTVLAILILALYGFRTALAGQSLFAEV